jgi:hypothetical protein
MERKKKRKKKTIIRLHPGGQLGHFQNPLDSWIHLFSGLLETLEASSAWARHGFGWDY